MAKLKIFRSFLTHSKTLLQNFKNFLFSWIFYWLTDSFSPFLTYLLMPSDKRNLIMAVTTGLISLLFNVASSGDMPFCQLQQLWYLHHGSNKAHLGSHLYSIPFPGDDLRYACYSFGAKLMQVECKQGALFTLIFAWNVSQTFKKLEAKWSVMIYQVEATHPLLYQ